MKHAQARLSAEAQACLISYPWPGNVRELDNAIQRALILQQGGLIQPQDFCLAMGSGAAPCRALRRRPRRSPKPSRAVRWGTTCGAANSR